MTHRSRALDPELLAMRAVERAILSLDQPAQIRVLEWACARALNMPGFDLDSGAKNARLAECLRHVRRSVGEFTSDRGEIVALLDRALKEATS